MMTNLLFMVILQAYSLWDEWLVLGPRPASSPSQSLPTHKGQRSCLPAPESFKPGHPVEPNERAVVQLPGKDLAPWMGRQEGNRLPTHSNEAFFMPHVWGAGTGKAHIS